LCSTASSVSRLPQDAADKGADAMLVAAAVLYIWVEATWFSREAKRGPVIGGLWAAAAFAVSALVLAVMALLFAGT
jgi:hypothetical protein